MGIYTSNLENSLFSSWDEFDTDEENYEKLLTHLNSNNFRTFGEGLTDFVIKRITGIDKNAIIKAMTETYKRQGVPLPSRNTLVNWIEEGFRPKKCEESREKMFQFSFAFQLSTQETAELFHKVYLDRAFYFRNPKEIIYYYCLERKLTYSHAVKLIDQMPEKHDAEEDKTVYTSVLEESFSSISSDNELLSFLAMHLHNMDIKNKTAKEILKNEVVKAKMTAEQERNYSPLIKELAYNRDRDSIDLLYDTILNRNVEENQGKSIFKNEQLPKEIRSCFPQPATFTKAEPTFEEIRKMLILLFSYNFWYRMGNSKLNIDIEDYIQELNSLLFNVGFSPLYYGNPHDWLYMYCSLESNALDRFRGIIAEIMDEDDEM